MNPSGNTQHRTGAFVSGVVVGVASMYFFDPDRGGRRRALARDKGARLVHASQDFLGKAGRDLRNRARGLTAGVRHRLHLGNGDPGVVAERVRAKMGRFVSHPHAIAVTTEQDELVLRGQILTDEMTPLLDAVSKIPGVQGVRNELEPHDQADVPALQGGLPPPGEPAEWQQRSWTPGLQLLTGAVAVGLLGTAMLRRNARRRGKAMPYRSSSGELAVWPTPVMTD
ncbi:MAG TPA: BON domain-containing protein [Candidatus Eisenbacteria bacterium]|nr:BON domain-containing protein [Candidatus Eisenbacteria bacterium]